MSCSRGHELSTRHPWLGSSRTFSFESSDTLKCLPLIPKGIPLLPSTIKMESWKRRNRKSNQQESPFYEAVRHTVKTCQAGSEGKELKSRWGKWGGKAPTEDLSSERWGTADCWIKWMYATLDLTTEWKSPGWRKEDEVAVRRSWGTGLRSTLEQKKQQPKKGTPSISGHENACANFFWNSQGEQFGLRSDECRTLNIGVISPTRTINSFLWAWTSHTTSMCLCFITSVRWG